MNKSEFYIPKSMHYCQDVSDMKNIFDEIRD